MAFLIVPLDLDSVHESAYAWILPTVSWDCNETWAELRDCEGHKPLVVDHRKGTQPRNLALLST